MKNSTILSILLITFIITLLISIGSYNKTDSVQLNYKCAYDDLSTSVKDRKVYSDEDTLLSTEQQRKLIDEISRMPDEGMLLNKKKGEISAYEPWQQRGPWGIHYYGVEPSITYAGRVTALAHNSDPEIGGLYIGAANGGLIRFKDNFTRISENLWSLRIGAVAVDPSNPKRIYLGTGDHGAGITGAGLYRTTNLGADWDSIPLPNPQPAWISKIIIKGNRIYVASDRGIYHSFDSGNNWTLGFTMSTSDLSIATDFSYMLAGVYGSGIHKSTDYGVTWNLLSDSDLPSSLANSQRISLCIAPNLSPKAYVQIGNTTDELLGIYKTTNAGDDWTKIQNPPPSDYLKQQRYNSVITVHPSNSNIVWVGGIALYRSSDGGSSWNGVGAVGSWPHTCHGDFHALLYVGNILYAGSDGGVFTTADEGTSWYSGINSYLPITQFYNIDVEQSGGECRCGGTQDNGLISTYQPDWWNWSMGRLGDGMDVAIHQGTPSVFIGTINAGGKRWRFNSGVLDGTDINDEMDAAGDNTQTWKYTYVEMGALGRFYTNAGSYIYWSTNSGNSWARMNSTAFDYEIRRFNVNSYSNCVYAALDANKSLKRLEYNGSSWSVSDISNGLPVRKVRRVCTDKCGEDVVYIIMNGGPEKIYRSTNRGNSWDNITGNIPSDLVVNDLIEFGSRIFIGTNFGAYISTNGGTEWIRWNTGMPRAAQITDMELTFVEGIWYIIAGTYGRSTFERPLMAMDPNLKIFKTKFALGSLIAGQEIFDSLIVQNSGEDTLRIWAARSLGRIETSIRPSSGVILPGDSLKFYFTFYIPHTGEGDVFGSVEFIHNTADSITSVPIIGYIGDNTYFRTFLPESLIVKKPVKNKIIANRWCFDFNNTNTNREPANELYVEFKYKVTGFESYEPFTIAENLDGKGKKWKFSGGGVPTGSSAIICGTTKKSQSQYVKQWWWVADIVVWEGISEGVERGILGRVEGIKMPDSQYPALPMPNTANLRMEIFNQVPINKYSPLIIGESDADARAKRIAYVAFAKHGDLYGSLTSGRSGKRHIGSPRYFDYFDNSKEMIGKIKKLKPDKQNNRLFAEIVALKVNIYASQLDITPVGFGELRYTESGNRLSGFLVRAIDSLADRYMTWGDSSVIGDAITLDSVIHKINSAFVGPPDTVSFSTQLKFTGVRPIAEVPFLERDPSIMQRRITPAMVNAELPGEFLLYQNYPNPFNPTTTIEFDLPTSAHVTLKIYNTLGQEVATLINNELMDEGSEEVEFNAIDFASGIYFYRLLIEEFDSEEVSNGKTLVSTKKMMLIK